MASIKGYTLKGLRTIRGTDGYVIRCTIAKNGKTVAEFFDGGYGGEPDVDMAGTMKRDEFVKDLKDLTPFYRRRSGAVGIDYGFGGDIDYDAGLLVDDLMNLMKAQKDYRKELRAIQKKCPSLDVRLAFAVMWTQGSIYYRWFPYRKLDEATEQMMKDIMIKMQREFEQKNGPENRTVVECFYSEEDFDLLKEGA